MIIGTAGHIDHGKTTLVRALTGVDTDRLKEEKARGISIELGYAYIPVPPLPDTGGQASADPADNVLGFIDVPGHEKFVHTMAAGASGIDHALLVVAADDGVMPQTREHLAIALLFGIRSGTVAITKADRVGAERLDEVRRQVQALLAGTPMADAPLFVTDATAVEDEGVAALRQRLFAQAQAQHQRGSDGLFRLAVDRVFTLPGHGTVVTGTVFGGRVRAGQTLTHSASGRVVRVRSLHAQNRAADTGHAGQRVALNLAGIDRHEIARGDWIADARLLQATQRIDVRLRLPPDAAPLGAWALLHVHLAAAHRQAHAVPLQADTVAPGAEARVQLVFDAPVFVVPGDRFIVRNAQGTRTVGGGVVLDPQAPERRRRSAARMQWLDALHTLVDSGDARPLLAVAPAGLTRSALTRLLGRSPPTGWAGEGAVSFALGRSVSTPLPSGERPGEGPRTTPEEAPPTEELWLSPAAWAAVRERITDALQRHHARAPDEPGLNGARLQRMAFPTLASAHGDGQGTLGNRLPAQGWQAWIDRLLTEQDADGQPMLERTGQWLHLPGHRVSLSEAEQALADRLHPLLLAGGNDPPWVRDLARDTGTREDTVRELLRKQARLGALYQVVKDLFYPAERMAELAAIFADLSAQSMHTGDLPPLPARERAEEGGRPAPRLPPGAVEARAFRDAVHLGRKRAIQILECFDRIGYTRRVGDAHLLRPNTRWTDEGPVTGP